jgi:NDP-sugar pyrophosphorylase family protein
MRFMRAMILSAGYGTRLWPLTEDRTKPALPILGKPLVGYVAEYLSSFGCDEILVNLHHQPESVKAALGDGSRFGVSLTYIEEPVILGTSGALDNARSLLENDTFIVVNGKIITDIDLNTALETHRQTKALATMVLLTNVARERFSVVEVEDGAVKKFGGMPQPGSGNGSTPLMFTGIHIFEPRIFDYIPRGVFSDSVTDVYPQTIAKGERISAHVAKGKWYELSTIQRYLEISLKLLAEKDESSFAGANSRIASGAKVQSSILWDNVSVEEGATVNRAILADGVQVSQGEVIENAAVVRASLIQGSIRPAKALQGEVRGENFVVPIAQ